MMLLCHNVLGGQRSAAEVSSHRITIGRGSHNHLVLDSPLVAFEAAVIERVAGFWRLHPLGKNGCTVGEREIARGNHVDLRPKQAFEIFPYQVVLEEELDALPENPAEAQATELVRTIHRRLLALMDVETEDIDRRDNPEYQLNLEHMIEQLATEEKFTDNSNCALAYYVAGQCVRQMLIESLFRRAGTKLNGLVEDSSGWSRLVSAVPHREQDLQGLISGLCLELQVHEIGDLSAQMERVDTGFDAAWQLRASDMLHDFLMYLALRSLKKQIKDIVFGYGPLEDLLRIPTISEIMVVDSNHIFIEKRGVVENSGRRFISDDVTLAVIDRIVSKVGRRIDKSQPLVDARLLDGSRVNAVIPPLAVSGPSITIRRFPSDRLRMSDLVGCGALTESAAQFLKAAVLSRRNILIAGGTGTGKTTLLNCLTDFIPTKERIVTIEDTAELQINKEHVVRMEVKQANAEGNGAYTIHDLVKNSLRMRPDRIIVGECRGGEALDMLQAMNTGHEGSLTTIHANNPRDVQLRLEVMVRTAADLPVESIHRQIASAVDLIVQLRRCRDGRRRVTQITEVVGMDDIAGGVRVKDLFSIEETADGDSMVPTGHLPTFIELLINVGYDLDNFYC